MFDVLSALFAQFKPPSKGGFFNGSIESFLAAEDIDLSPLNQT